MGGGIDELKNSELSTKRIGLTSREGMGEWMIAPGYGG
jgi:hypothetical protein